MESTETYFQHIPQELSILIFMTLGGFIDSKNFIKGSNLIDLFSRGSTWSYIFSHTFRNLKLNRVTSIDYTKNSWYTYLLIYYGLANSYSKTFNAIKNDSDIRIRTIKNYYNINDTKTSEMPEELKDNLTEQLVGYHWTINLATFYDFADESMKQRMDSDNIDKIGDVILKMRPDGYYSLFNYWDPIVYNVILNIDSTIEFLMYAFYNEITGGWADF